ncbi:hypothetical protein AB205_0132950, partial [Aquarana catesbeiana]
VHKETIDAVPNAIPGRTDIELEIYGMEGIPEKDMEERRRMLEQKTQVDGQKKRMDDSDYDDDDDSGPSSSFPPQMQQQQGYMQAMAQPGLHGLTALSGPVGTDFKPLNSAPVTTSEPPKPTFPAYTQSTMSTTSTTNSTAAKPSPSITSKPATLTTTSATSKLIHPDEDISLEEKRAQHMKYQRNLPRPGQAPMGGMGSSAVGPLGAMMAPQQGMPPQQPGMRHPMPPHDHCCVYIIH